MNRTRPRNAIIAALLMATAAIPASAGVIGTMVPFESLAAQSFEKLPAQQRDAWRSYLKRSTDAMARDKAMLADERTPGRPVPPPPPEPAKGDNSMPLDKPASWYAGSKALAIADNIVSFQTPAGGWGKNQDRVAPARQRGQHYIPADAKAGAYAAQDGAGGWSFVGTIDNDATITELQFLAHVQSALPGKASDRYRASFLKGMDYLFAAEFPNGGWPQVWPLQGGYHDALTINDDAMVHVIELMRQVGRGEGSYAFVRADIRKRASAAAARGLDVLLDAQIVVDGKPSIWAQQYDPVSLRPVSARNFEPIALSTAESAAVLDYLMADPQPSLRVRTAIASAAEWFEAHAIHDMEWTPANAQEGRKLVSRPGARPVWARFYAPDTGKPVFGDRDRTIHDEPNAISVERRNGYAWFNTVGSRVENAYAKWRKRLGYSAR